MGSIVRLYSEIPGEINKFLEHFYGSSIIRIKEADLEWEKNFENPIEIVDIIGAFIENNDIYKISMWICIDEGCFIHVSDDNADDIIRYLYERFPY